MKKKLGGLDRFISPEFKRKIKLHRSQPIDEQFEIQRSLEVREANSRSIEKKEPALLNTFIEELNFLAYDSAKALLEGAIDPELVTVTRDLDAEAQGIFAVPLLETQKDKDVFCSALLGFFEEFLQMLNACRNWDEFSEFLENVLIEHENLMHSLEYNIKIASQGSGTYLHLLLPAFGEMYSLMGLVKEKMQKHIDALKIDEAEVFCSNICLYSNEIIKSRIDEYVYTKKSRWEKMAFLERLMRIFKKSHVPNYYILIQQRSKIVRVDRETQDVTREINYQIIKHTPVVHFESPSQIRILKSNLISLVQFDEEKFKWLTRNKTEIRSDLKKGPSLDVGLQMNRRPKPSDIIRFLYSAIGNFGPSNSKIDIGLWIFYLFLDANEGFSISNIIDSPKRK